MNKFSKTVQYKKSFVVFLDIIGFKNHFKKNMNNNRHELLELISTFVRENGNGFCRKNENKGDQIRPYINSFSDCLVLSCPIENGCDSFSKNLNAILNAVSIFACMTLYKGYFLRGALSIGDFYHENGVIIGYPLIECVECEKNEDFPRITVTPAFIEEFKQFEHEQEKTKIWCVVQKKNDFWICTDNLRKSYYFDYMRYFDPLSRSPQDPQNTNTLKKIINKLEKEILIEKNHTQSDFSINSAIENSQSIIKKLTWMKNYLSAYKNDYGLT